MALHFLDYLGVFVFAITGALVAIRKDMDIFGCVVLALMPAVGGGTVRDLILDVPVFWVVDNRYLFITLAAALLTFVAYRFVLRVGRLILWCDAIGLSVFCALGTAKALEVTGKPVVSVMMGVVTAVAGGIARDVIANDIPLVLHKEVYATAAFAGALAYVFALPVFGTEASIWLAVGVALVGRGLGIGRGWSLPKIRNTE
ncbi:MAG: trimeric intracellular cation channel family protein [Pseudomonadaceae bacterium]|nr:trimeric intracellular cation channel family protein [Pseudomonadaceae bacterium]